MNKLIKKLPLIKKIIEKIDDFFERKEWVEKQLIKLPENSVLLDAGCGDQQFKPFCDHLNYKAQDFGKYKNDEKKMLGGEYNDIGGDLGYQYGKLDYVGDIWDIKEADSTFDAILCTEVLEHIPYPNETIKEFSRLIKSGGTLILTAPNACLRHMDPYFFYTGFSDRWYEKFLTENGFEIEEIIPVGDYYSWLSTEMARTAISHSIIVKIILFPAFLYYYNKKKTKISINTLCKGYHIRARKK